MSVRMRVTRAHTGNRRSHHALKEPRLSKCAHCSSEHLRHRMCPDCGYYRTRQVVDIVAQQEKRQKRREERMKAAGEAIEQEDAAAAAEAASQEKTKEKEENPAKKEA